MQKWKQIIDYPNYEVSNLGRVRNKQGHIITQSLDSKGHLKCMLYKKGKHYPLVHRLVFEAFYRKLQPNEVVHHLSQIKTQNYSTNLVAWDKTRHYYFHREKYVVSQQTKKKQSKALKGIKFSQQHIQNLTISQRKRRQRQKELALK